VSQVALPLIGAVKTKVLNKRFVRRNSEETMPLSRVIGVATEAGVKTKIAVVLSLRIASTAETRIAKGAKVERGEEVKVESVRGVVVGKGDRTDIVAVKAKNEEIGEDLGHAPGIVSRADHRPVSVEELESARVESEADLPEILLPRRNQLQNPTLPQKKGMPGPYS